MWTWLQSLFSPRDLPVATPIPEPELDLSEFSYGATFKHEILFRGERVGWQEKTGALHLDEDVPMRVRLKARAFADIRIKALREKLDAPLDPSAFRYTRFGDDIAYKGIEIGRVRYTYVYFEDNVPAHIRQGAEAFAEPKTSAAKARIAELQAEKAARRKTIFEA